MKFAAAYIRVSTDQQTELSPASQLKEIKKFAQAHELVLNEEYIFTEQEGRSGRKSANRPQFQRMIGMAKTQPRPFDVILVWKFSRFARNQEESIVYKSMLRNKCGVDVLSVSEPLVDGPFGELIERIIEWMDEYYSIRLSGEVLRGMTEKAQRGGIVSSPAYGYKVENGVYVPIPEEAQTVRLVFEKFVNESAGLRDLAAMLNSLGVRTKKGFPMENRTVEYMLHNPVYIGKIRWSPQGKLDRDYDRSDVILTDGSHEPILSEELFQRAQEKLAVRKKMYAKHAHESAHKNEYMLRGLVRCSNCGSTLVYCSGGNGGLQCHSYAKGACKESHYISVQKANQRVIDLIEQCFTDESFALQIREKTPAVDERKLIAAQIAKEKAKLERIRAAYESGIDTLEEYRYYKEKITQTLRELEQRQPETQKSPERMRRDFISAHKSAVADLRNPAISEGDKNMILRGFVEHIVFDRYKNKFQIFFFY